MTEETVGEEADLECAHCGVSIHDEPLLECGDHLLCHECKAESDADSKAAAVFEYHAHGDTSGLDDYPSEYDLDPGVRYNDGGEPIGFM